MAHDKKKLNAYAFKTTYPARINGGTLIEELDRRIQRVYNQEMRAKEVEMDHARSLGFVKDV